MIALCAVLSGGQTAVDMAVFAEAKQDFLGSFLQLKNGVPSHDTFSRVFRQLDPDQFRACFQRFMARFSEACTGVIAIDGKVLRRPVDPAHPGSALHMVSAWCCDTSLVLAQIATTAKTRESTGGNQAIGNVDIERDDRNDRRAQLSTRHRTANHRLKAATMFLP